MTLAYEVNPSNPAAEPVQESLFPQPRRIYTEPVRRSDEAALTAVSVVTSIISDAPGFNELLTTMENPRLVVMHLAALWIDSTPDGQIPDLSRNLREQAADIVAAMNVGRAA